MGKNPRRPHSKVLIDRVLEKTLSIIVLRIKLNIRRFSYGWSYIPGFNMMADLQSGSERAFKVVDLPMKSHVGEISEIESWRKRK